MEKQIISCAKIYLDENDQVREGRIGFDPFDVVRYETSEVFDNCTEISFADGNEVTVKLSFSEMNILMKPNHSIYNRKTHGLSAN